ncbi:MAG: Gmad2 immunoglobulin-like domain-containing protein [Nocardioides sp.]
MNIEDLLHDAVDEIEPADRLDEIRARTVASPTASARPWWYAAGGVVLATAAAVTAFAVLGGDDPSGQGHEHDHTATQPPTGTQLVAAYFVGDAPEGERLYREFDEVPSGDHLQAALDRIERPANDPDYRTPWTATSFGDVSLRADGIHVELEDAVLDDDLAVQQVVYTLQAAAGEQLPVYFDDVEGVGTVGHEAEPQNEVLNLVSISDPAEGSAYSGAFTARGRANAFEGTVAWEVRDETGTTVREGFTTADGSMDRLHPWQARVDVTGLPAGSYTFVATSTDPSGGAEQSRLDSDTRTIVVR